MGLITVVGHDADVARGVEVMQQSPERTNGATPDRREWIAILDDDPAIRRSLARLLRIEGLTVETFATPIEFFAALSGGVPSCLVLDVHLGSDSGFDVQDRLVVTHPGVPVIFITGHDRISSAELARRVGPDGYARKPFDGDVMIEMVRRRTEMLGKTA